MWSGLYVDPYFVCGRFSSCLVAQQPTVGLQMYCSNSTLPSAS